MIYFFLVADGRNKKPEKRSETMNENELVTNGTFTPAMAQWASSAGVEPVVLKQAMEEAGLAVEPTPAENLVDTEIVITGAKRFKSAYPDSKVDPYFVRGYVKESGEVFASVFGGQAVVEVIEAYIGTGSNRPLQCVLRENEGGQFGRYYTLG